MRSQAHRPGSGFDDRPVGLGHLIIAGGAFVVAAVIVAFVAWLFLQMLLGGQPYEVRP